LETRTAQETVALDGGQLRVEYRGLRFRNELIPTHGSELSIAHLSSTFPVISGGRVGYNGPLLLAAASPMAWWYRAYSSEQEASGQYEFAETEARGRCVGL
jgi:hypothetical protein